MGAVRSRSAARRGALGLATVATVALAAAAGCGDSPPGRTFYQRNIEPILTQKCAGNTSGCHATNADDPYQFAAGNFDVTSFDNVQKRRDLLVAFGAYAYPLLLIKAAPTGALKVYYDTKVSSIDPFRPLEVLHSGGPILDVNSDAFFTLQNWLENGATENGVKPSTPPQTGSGACSTAIPPDFAPGALDQASLAAFKTSVQPILTRHGCNAASCHGAPQSDFYITCGASDDQIAFNFSQARGFVSASVDDSQILRVPLAISAGGHGHTGGDQFSGTSDADYVAIKAWAMQAGPIDFAGTDPGRKFFASYVQPLLLARGCSFQACHSPSATNDFKLRSGSQGFFSPIALKKNYDLLKNDFMALEFPDAKRGRAMAKALLSSAGGSGIAHRGGPVLEAPGALADRTTCAFNPALPSQSSPFCVIQTWLDTERAAIAAQVTDMTAAATTPLVYVQRAAGAVDTDPLAFDTFRAGTLMSATATFGAGEKITVAGPAPLADNCGLPAGADMRSPDVANDGDRVVFAARADATQPLEIYVVKLSDHSCTPVTTPVADSNGIKVHNFDPVFSPDGNWIAFASTRGKSGTGATRSRKRLLPQSDLWRIAIAGTTANQGSLQQLTFLSNSEIRPHFMREGRITMTTEKASSSDDPNQAFYQLSGRRLNWDLTDYHPLLGQRSISPYASLTDLTQTKPSIGYASVTDIREGSDGNFLVILSDLKADGSPAAAGGGGALAIFNRSIGPFEQGRTDPGFLRALRIVDNTSGQPLATGHADSAASYRGPSSLPSGEILVAYAPSAATGNFDLVAIDPHTGAQTPLFTADGNVRVDGVLAYKYPPRALYTNRRQLVFGGATDSDTAHAVLHMPDAPMVFTLLTGNLRRGRPVDDFRKAKFLAIYSEGLCPAGGCTTGGNGIFEQRTLLGTVPLADDGSTKVRLPSQTGVVLELQDANHASVVKMHEEHQLGPGEEISMGIVEPLFDAVCGGCHGSVSGHEVDVRVTADALTGASASISATKDPMSVGP